MAEYQDIDLALKELNLPLNKVIIMQCTSEYPCPPENCNLNVITTLKKKYENVIGCSDHSDGILAPTIACLLGAKIIEKAIEDLKSVQKKNIFIDSLIDLAKFSMNRDK